MNLGMSDLSDASEGDIDPKPRYPVSNLQS